MTKLSGADPGQLIEKIEELIAAEQEKKQLKLNELGKVIAKTRDRAVAARRESGFEQQWREDEEFNAGIDELSREETQYQKPRSDSGGLTTKSSRSSVNQCTAFPNITRPFVESAEARLGDILLPAKGWNFSIDKTPVPEFEDHEDDETPMILGPDGQPAATVRDVIKDRNKRVSLIVKKAETRIKDWLVQTDYKRESRKVIAGTALVGSGVFEGPVPVKRTIKQFKDGALEITEEIMPGSKRIDHWDFFPDMSCGENIQDGDYVIKRDYLTARQLENLRGMDYIDSAIDKVIKEGPGKRNVTENKRTHDDDRFEVWYYYGTIDAKDLRLLDTEYDCGCEGAESDDAALNSVSAVIVMVNDTVIQGYKNPLDHYGYPFDVVVWQRVPGQPFGVGIARQGRVPQKTVTAAFRKLMENQGLSAMPMLAMIKGALEPADGNMSMYAGKHWYIKESSGIRNVNEAIQTIKIDSMQAELTALIELGMQMMENSTGITFLMQGQQGAAPDTVGGMQMLLQSSSAVLRRCVRIYDDSITIPHINRYYGWLLMYGEDDEKGDLMIEAIGSSSLAEREIQSMQIPQILQFAQDPAFGLSKKKAVYELLKSWRFNPSSFEMDEEEKQAAEQAQPPQDPRIVVEQMRAEKDIQLNDKKLQVEQIKVQSQVDRDALFQQSVMERNRNDYESTIAELQLRERLAMLEYANKHQDTLDNIKAKLADSSMKLQVQKELSMLNDSAKQVITPPSEPIGRANNGEAYQR